MESGLTIVEVMVASVILGLVVSAVTVMIGNSDFLHLNNDHFRQARIIAQEELEDPTHHFLNYNTPGEMLDLNSPIYLDFSEEGLNQISATRQVTVRSKTFGVIIPIPYKLITSTVSWTEGDKNFSVTLTKRVVAVK